MSKLKRGPNFSAKEEEVLISLVNKYRSQVECKRTDTNSNKVKAAAWVKIETDFNAIVGDCYRSAAILRNKYENMKKRTKQKVGDRRRNQVSTGGGPSQVIVLTPTEEKLEQIMGPQLSGLPSEFDGDSKFGTSITFL